MEPSDGFEHGSRLARRAGRAIFGDRVGLVVFLGGLVFVSLYWRIGIFLTDSYAVGNTLVNVADGHLAIRRTPYSLTFGTQPGLSFADGQVYGRNYGHVFLSVPVLWLLEAAGVLFDLRLFLAAGWSLLVLALFEQLGRCLGRDRAGTLAGSGLALAGFLGNAAVATPLSDKWVPFVALQVTTMVAASLVGVGIYRLLGAIHGERVGTLFGVGTVLATPVGFWASVPKRHAFLGLAVVVVLGSFYASRASEQSGRTLRFRALGYGTIALATWVHAPEALFLLLVFVPLDLLTARANGPRQLLVIGVVFGLALGPFLVTNLAISGNPVTPPRLLPEYDGQDLGNEPVQPDQPAQSEIATTPTGSPDNDTTTDTPTPETPGPDDGTQTPGLADRLADTTESIRMALGTTTELVTKGTEFSINRPETIVRTLVRSGRAPVSGDSGAVNQQEAIELTVLETLPVLGVLAALPVLLVGRLRHLSSRPDGRLDRLRTALSRPVRQTDLLACGIATVYLLAYLPRLPTHSQLTVRYLLPMSLALLYGVGRLGVVRDAVTTEWQWLWGSWGGAILTGGVGFLLAHATLGLALGEAMQLHALVNLAGAGVLGLWAVGTAWSTRDAKRLGATLLGTVLGLGTLFLLFTGLTYFQYADYALPLAERLAELIPVSV